MLKVMGKEYKENKQESFFFILHLCIFYQK